MNYLSLVIITTLVISILSVLFIIKRNFKKGIIGIDINKLKQNKVAESCGIVLLLPFWALIIFYILGYGFDIYLIFLGLLVSVFGIVGYFDDRKHKFMTKTLSWELRAAPIAIISFVMATAFFFPQNIFEMALLILITMFVAGFASFVNTFEGLNGWGIGSSFIIALFAAFVSWQIDWHISILYMGLSAIIFALLIFNKYPAKAFPGDSGTLMIGSAITGIAVFSQNIFFVIFIVLLFIPHMIDFFVLKLLTNKDDASQQKIRPYKLLKNGLLTIPDYKGRTKYDFAKLIMKVFGPLKEWKIVLIIWIIVIINSLIWASIFTNFIF
jgi:UDP-N-acetylglucosamine--dolichyl-phosphate N-acetylglucosaminephosphotransferase